MRTEMMSQGEDDRRHDASCSHTIALDSTTELDRMEFRHNYDGHPNEKGV
jgi:hypothetical protein